jgi:hypothetical protein
MATATISKSGDNYTISGGSSSDYVTIKDIQAAANSDLAVLHRNAVNTTSKKSFRYICDSNSYIDFSGARIFLRNNSNGQRLYFRFNGHIRIGSSSDKLRFCEIHWGEKDTGGYNNNTYFPLFGVGNTYIDCPNVNNRIKIMSHLDGPNSGRAAEPAARNGVWLENNRSNNKIRISVLGASYTYGSSYVLPNATGFKPNGTIMVQWRIGPNVTVRDIEFRDGYIDWRPSGTWDAPTRGIFVSETWMKFLGTKTFTVASPLIFGNANDSFEVVVGNSGQSGSYLLHGLRPSASGVTGRIVYNNFKGLAWSTQMALYGGGHRIEVENHISLSYTLIDSLAQPVNGAVITLYKKDPVYNSNHDDVNFSGAEISFDTTTDSTGKGNIGNADGNLAHNICIEAFCRRNTNGGNVDGAYANKDHAYADYANYTSLYYTIIKWGQKPVIRTAYTAKLAGQTGEGKQTLGVIQLEKDLSLTATTESAVASTITDAASFYDNAYKYALNNKINLFCEKIGNKIKSDYSIVFDNSVSQIISVSGSVITVKASSFSSSIESVSGTITFKTAFNLSSLRLTGAVHYDLGADSTIQFSKVTVDDNIYNDDNSHKLTINLVDTSTGTAGDPGTGNGQTNIVHPVTLKVTVLDESGSGINLAHVILLKDSDNSTVLSGTTNSSGIYSTTYNYTSNIPIHGWARQYDLTGDDYNEKAFSGTITSTGFETVLTLIKE